jgi:plasmid maintenance system antidote protein VapI
MNLASVVQIPALGAVSIELLIIIGLAILCLILAMYVIHAHRRITRILRGNNTITIEDSIIELAKELDTLTDFKERAEEYHAQVEQRLRKSVQSIETKRFNPFKGTGAGGNQSFASAFINENGDGLILSSLYSSDRMSVFAKPVQGFTSSFELTEEEASALEDAQKRVSF